MFLNKLTISALLITLSGCVSFEIPDTLISNTIESSTRAYQDLTRGETTEKLDPQADDHKGTVFSLSFPNEKNESREALKNSCLLALERKAKDKLKMEDIIYKVMSDEVVSENDLLVANCKISVI